LKSIVVEGLTERFGALIAVDHLSFEVEEGEVFGLLGPNGAGKTTTARMLACLISPSEGTASVDGYNLANEPLKIRENVGILTETPSLYERLTVQENMDFFAEAYGVTDVHVEKKRIRDLLEFFELWERRDDKVGALSKGMKQKLAIARTLVHHPPILLLDEPTSGLDPEAAKGIRDLMKLLSTQEKHTILLCTHRLEDAERLCDRVMIVNKGKRVVVGTPQGLQEQIAGRHAIQIALKELDQRIIRVVKENRYVKSVVADERAARLDVTTEDLLSATPELVRRIVRAGGKILSVTPLRPSLEEAYLKLIRGEERENP